MNGFISFQHKISFEKYVKITGCGGMIETKILGLEKKVKREIFMLPLTSEPEVVYSGCFRT